MSTHRVPGSKNPPPSQGTPQTQAPTGRTYPPVSKGRLWLNLDYAADWGRDNLFIDVMRTARAWRAETSTQFDDARARATMMATADADGYPTQIPPGVKWAGTFVLMEQAPESAPVLGGRYRMEYQGAGTVLVSGANQTRGAGWIEFDYTPDGSNSVDVRISSTTAGNHIRGMRCYMLKHADLLAAGQRVHPAFKAAWGGVGLLRFMLPLSTNEAQHQHWAEAPQPTSICRGLSYREVVEVCNELGCHGWFNLPMRATADYVTQAARVVRDHLNPALKAYVEWSNEWWNSAPGFAAHPYVESLRAGKPYNFAEQAGGRSAETMAAWSAVFAGQMHRTVRVANVHTHWHGLEEAFLNAPGWVAEASGRPVPHTLHDAIAVTGYFSPGSSWPEVISAARANYEKGMALLVKRVEEDVEAHRTKHYPYFRRVADRLGKSLVMYEGGTHTTNPGGLADAALANRLANDFNHGPAIYGVYNKMMRVWSGFGDGAFNQFSSTRRFEPAGTFGAQLYINDFNQQRYKAARDYNAGALPTARADIEPLPLSLKLIVTGHSISDAIMNGELQGAIAAMGGSANITRSQSASSTAQWRWNECQGADVRGLLQAPGAHYDAFLGVEAQGGGYGSPPRCSVQAHIAWSDAHTYATLWHNLAAGTGARTFYANVWCNDPLRAFDAAWRAAQDLEAPLWDDIIDHVNTHRSAGTPEMRLVPWLQMFNAVYDAIQSEAVTGIGMADLFTDDVHCATPIGRWLQIATALAVIYRRHPDTLPADAGEGAQVSDALAVQLRPIVWATCLAIPRTGLA